MQDFTKQGESSSVSPLRISSNKFQFFFIYIIQSKFNWISACPQYGCGDLSSWSNTWNGSYLPHYQRKSFKSDESNWSWSYDFWGNNKLKSTCLCWWICDCCMKHRFHCNADICWLHDLGWATLSARTVVRIFGDGSWLGLFCQEIIQTLLSLTLWHWIQLYWCYFHTSCEARKFVRKSDLCWGRFGSAGVGGQIAFPMRFDLEGSCCLQGGFLTCRSNQRCRGVSATVWLQGLDIHRGRRGLQRAHKVPDRFSFQTFPYIATEYNLTDIHM